MYNRVVELLTKAKKLIDKPEKWTKKAGSRDAGGVSVDVSSNQSVCFCSLGALIKAQPFEPVLFGAAKDLLDSSCPKFFLGDTPGWILAYNDAAETTHEDVMKVFDKAIAKAEKLAAKDAAKL